ncbi:hypothetical protein Vretimale_417 [Volvox reticuliferus]|uniref:Uncharacterized protein n=1 Tax=Volvox reticuliferus TaxID=1737510 RepID=A0A8J4C0R6_9CHLO|nr:hypothetical protein Vretifemale_2656 [Volvox reticuliferus]GIL94084.1 hypothetical protein Vretimale_417 [Volvox reticuliferus]
MFGWPLGLSAEVFAAQLTATLPGEKALASNPWYNYRVPAVMSTHDKWIISVSPKCLLPSELPFSIHITGNMDFTFQVTDFDGGTYNAQTAATATAAAREAARAGGKATCR